MFNHSFTPLFLLHWTVLVIDPFPLLTFPLNYLPSLCIFLYVWTSLWMSFSFIFQKNKVKNNKWSISLWACPGQIYCHGGGMGRWGGGSIMQWVTQNILSITLTRTNQSKHCYIDFSILFSLALHKVYWGFLQCLQCFTHLCSAGSFSTIKTSKASLLGEGNGPECHLREGCRWVMD